MTKKACSYWSTTAMAAHSETEWNWFARDGGREGTLGRQGGGDGTYMYPRPDEIPNQNKFSKMRHLVRPPLGHIWYMLSRF
jgi:hypothetical protein